MSKATKALLQIAIALVLAMGAGVLVFMWTTKLATQQAAAPKAQTVPVVVAKADLKQGTKLDSDKLEVRQFTKGSRPTGSFADIDSLEGRVLNTQVGASEVITQRKLADPSVMGGGVSALVAPGMRAMAVKGNAVMGLSGFVRPGDRVDVITTMNVGSHDNPVTKLVLERVKVLATGTQLTPPDAEGMTASVDVYTLELTPRESERLALAATQGTLNFALRNEQDEKGVLTTGYTKRKALNALRPKPKPKGPVTPPIKVEVITGGDIMTLKF